MKGQFPWIGRSRGSAGGMTTAKINNKNVMRAKAFEVNNPNTPAQQNQRNYFTELTTLAGSFTSEQLKTLFPRKPKSMSRRNALTKQLGEDWTTINGAKVIDFANIDTLGNALTMDFGTTEIQLFDRNITVQLDDSFVNNPNVASYNYICVLVNETKKEISMPHENAIVEDNDYQAPYPTGWERTDTIHAIPLVTNVIGIETLGDFGSFIIKTRPEKKGRDIQH